MIKYMKKQIFSYWCISLSEKVPCMAIKDRTKVFSKYKKMGVMLYEKLTTKS